MTETEAARASGGAAAGPWGADGAGAGCACAGPADAAIAADTSAAKIRLGMSDRVPVKRDRCYGRAAMQT
ncbi:hypothetical protein BURPS668_A1528 [Burkholderia pseudomallei 668]|nr:hypothetical protein BURPS668_A1528 [Burkholderia pseudomallei 668]